MINSFLQFNVGFKKESNFELNGLFQTFSKISKVLKYTNADIFKYIN